MTCTNCKAPYDPRVARDTCARCGATLRSQPASPASTTDAQVQGILGPEPASHPLTRPLPLPEGVEERVHAHGVTIEVRWLSLLPLWVHGFLLLASTLAVFGRSWEMLFGIAFAILWIGHLVNSTVIDITPDGVDIRRGPLPWLGFTGRVPAKRVPSLRVRQRHMGWSRGGAIPFYQLATSHEVLMDRWAQRPILEYIRTRIEQIVEIPALAAPTAPNDAAPVVENPDPRGQTEG